MMNCLCGIFDQQKVFSLISSHDHCQRFSLLHISNTPLAEFEPRRKPWWKMITTASWHRDVRRFIESKRERQPQHIKIPFFFKDSPSIFTSIAPELWSQQDTSWPSQVSCRSDPSSETTLVVATNLISCHTLSERLVSSAYSPILHIILWERPLIYSNKSLGPWMEPCEIPTLTGYSYEDFPSNTEPLQVIYHWQKTK